MKGDFTRFTDDPKRHYRGVLMQQGRVQLDADWNESLAIASAWLRTLTTDVVGACGVPIAGDAFAIDASASTDFTIKGGRIYVNGLLCELDADATYSTQPDYPNPPDLNLGAIAQGQTRTDLIYVDAWNRPISAIEDPHLREVALGGPDTAERLKLMTQVKVKTNVDPASTCASDFGLTPTGGGTMQVIAAAPPQPPDPCEPTARGGYQGPDNRFYRVEIHDGGPLNAATFKWSRDNGSVTAAVEHFNSATELELRTLGRDDYLKFKRGDVVEVADDVTALNGSTVALSTIVDLNEAQRTITINPGADAGIVARAGAQPDRHPQVRRWDGGLPQSVSAAPTIPLEAGLSVQFAATGTDFRSGDYWTFAARVVDGSLDPAMDTPTPAQGVEHSSCNLALVTWRNAGETVVMDNIQPCRLPFPPLTQLPTGEGGCECAACVSAESHNSGTLTIQAAIQNVEAKGGGNICLGPGQYFIKEPIIISTRNIHLRGHGRETRLLLEGNGDRQVFIHLLRACDCSLERLAILGSATTPEVTVTDCLDTTIRGCAFLQESSPNAEGPAVPALRLEGSLVRTCIDNNLFIAPVGVGTHPDIPLKPALGSATVHGQQTLVLAETAITDNRFLCSRIGVFLGTVYVFVARALLVARNQFGLCAEFGLVLDGWVAPRGQTKISDNLFDVQSIAIATSPSRLRIEGNTFTSEAAHVVPLIPNQGMITLFNRQDGPIIRDVAVIGNVMEHVLMHGISILANAESVLIKQNIFRQLNGAAVLNTTAQLNAKVGGRVQGLAIENNQFIDTAATKSVNGVAGAVILHLVTGAVVANNTIRGIGQNVFQVRVAAISLTACTDVNVTGNTLVNIGPPQGGLDIAGIEASAPVYGLIVADNQVRRSAATPSPSTVFPGTWIALRIAGGVPQNDGESVAARSFAAPNMLFVTAHIASPLAGDVVRSASSLAAANSLVALSTEPQELSVIVSDVTHAVSAIPLGREAAGAQDNVFEGSGSGSIVQATGLTQLTFVANRCFLLTRDITAALTLGASLLILGNNTVDGNGYSASIDVQFDQAITAVGNIVRRPMNNVPSAWDALNIVL